MRPKKPKLTLNKSIDTARWPAIPTMRLRDAVCHFPSLLSISALVILLSGCAMSDTADNQAPPAGGSATPAAPDNDPNHMRTDPFRVGDRVSISFSGSPNPIPPVETEIKGDGTVHLDFIGDVRAEGMTPGEMERDIQSKYVPNYYTHLSVTVVPMVRYFYVDGEINGGGGGGTSGGRIVYSGPITVTQAIAAAGGFNPFARRTKVKLFRVGAKKAITINCIKALDNPELDLPVYSRRQDLCPPPAVVNGSTSHSRWTGSWNHL